MIYHSPKHHYLLAEWRGQHDSESVRLGCQRLLQEVYNTGSTHLLNDSSEAFGEWKEIAIWIGSVFVPQLQHAGMEAIAWVNAMDWPARSCVASSLQYTSQPFVASFDFDQMEEAQHWLLEAGC
ncbi:STAS/SEC14 domain-containing protein [Hymenobacter canadensis]|uniref:STAS/SEC14 domain-containing protein n=1 Tax=Hymenobacter canadensis TaxID=2999067 RepID=A0ABY7LU53_9BACT|nr:STAS/SEC14 domain-containing protein [Hymenobacter canadensis]WBA42413.1 STAS/SEC14 domain-containing protein [Hymenobacter canadensis]